MTTYKDFAETEKEFTTRIAAFIRERRQAIGKSQQQLADAVGCSAPTISALEMGKARLTLHRANLCANFLGVSLAELVIGGTPAHRAHVLAQQVRDGIIQPRTREEFHMVKSMEIAREMQRKVIGGDL